LSHSRPCVQNDHRDGTQLSARSVDGQWNL